MDALVHYSFVMPLLPGLAIGVLAGLGARDERSALLLELGGIASLAACAAALWGPAYALIASIWMFLGSQGAAVMLRYRRVAE